MENNDDLFAEEMEPTAKDPKGSGKQQKRETLGIRVMPETRAAFETACWDMGLDPSENGVKEKVFKEMLDAFRDHRLQTDYPGDISDTVVSAISTMKERVYEAIRLSKDAQADQAQRDAKKISTISEKNAELQAKIEGLKRERDEAQARVKEIQVELAVATESADTRKQRVEMLETELLDAGNWKVAKTDLESRLRKLEDELHAAQTALVSVQHEKALTDQRIDSLTDEVVRLKGEAATREAKLEKVEEQRDEAVKARLDLTQALADAKLEIGSLRTKLGAE